MKRVLFIALALFSFAAFFSCSNAAGGSDSESSKPSSASASKKPGYVTLTGTVSVSGAVPKILSDNYDSSSDNDGVSRSAQPGINTNGSEATMEYFARATSGNLVSEGVFGTGAEAKMFGLELQAGIEWTIVVGVREKSPQKLIPERTVYLSSTWKVTPDPAAPTISHNFVPVPNTSGDGTGSIALKINYSPSLYEITPKFVDGPSGFEALNVWTPIDADGGRIYKMSNIPSGKYELCIDFTNTASHVLVYSTIQSVTVANGMITDSWVADSSSSAVSPISAAGEFKFDSSAGGNAQALMAAFLGTNLFVGKVSDDCAAPDDTNSGNYLSPLKTVTGAVKKIAQAGSGGADYVIRVRGEVSGVGTNSAATITSSLISTSNAKSLTIIGTSGDGTDCIKSANSQAPAVNISTNVPITFKKIKIMGSKSGAGPGEAINAFGGSKVTIDEGSLITGGKIGVNVTGDSTKVTMKGGSFSGNDADVYLESGKVLTVDCNLSDVADKGIVVSLQSWTRGTQFLEAGASLGTLSDAIVGKFDFTKTGWDTPIYDSEKKAKIDADIYVAASGKDSETVDGIAVENTIGNKAYPFKTIAKAAALLDASHNKICIDGSVGKQTISATDLPTSKCSSLILCGANGLDDDDIPKDKIDAGGTSDCGTALTIGTAVPITIQNLKITGGNKGNSSPNYNKGGGIYLQSGSSLELADGAMVTGNTCGLYGGGIYTESNTTLFMYGTSYVGDKTATTASGNDPAKCSNSASYGGGIHNCGKVYLGYKKDGSSFKEADWTGGVCRNYVENNGGGIYNSTSGEIKMRAGTISYNKGSRYAGGIAVSASGNAVELLGGTLKENEANIGGGAVYVENSFSMQGSAYIPSGVKNNSGVLVSGMGKNDVYLVDGQTVTVAGTLSPKSNGLSSGTTKTNSIEALALSSWSRGTKFLSATSTNASSLVAAKSKIALSKDPNGWTKSDDATTSSADTRYAWITSPIYVAGSSGGAVCSAPPSTGNNGTKTSPYATIAAALAATDLPKADNTIIIDGTLSRQTIANTTSMAEGISEVTLKGYKAAGATSSAAKIDGEDGGVAFNINLSKTFTIIDLQITKGKSSSGGGMYIGAGTVNLDSGAKVYSNKANANGNGGGIYVAYGATLNIKSGSEIFSNTAYSENINGGGVYNLGTVNIYSGSLLYSNSANNGGAIYNTGTLSMSGGTIGQNSAGTSRPNTATASGGAIYQGGTFNMSGSAVVCAAGSENSNDVYIVSGKYITVPSSFTGSATIAPPEWTRGKQVLDGAKAGDCASNFSVIGGSEWSVVKDSSVGKLDAEIWVSSTSATDSTRSSGVGQGSDSNRGTKSQPYATIKTAVSKCWNGPNDKIVTNDGITTGRTIHIDGLVQAASNTEHEIPSTFTSANASAITLVGSAKSGNAPTLKAASNKRVLNIATTVPVTIQSLTITGGNNASGNGGGISVVSSGRLSLANGAIVNGNTASLGGGVYLGSSAKLFMYGTARIGGSANTAATTTTGNVATGAGAGVYEAGGAKIYLGYTDCNSDNTPKTSSATALTGGIKQNYCENNGGGVFLYSGTVYFNSGNISYNYTEKAGGGVCVSDQTTLIMTGGTMKGNEVGDGSDGNGGALYVTKNGTFKISGGASIPSTGSVKNNDIWLGYYSTSLNASITIDDNVTSTDAMWVTCEQYMDDEPIIKQTGSGTGKIAANYLKFKVMNKSNWSLGPDGKLHSPNAIVTKLETQNTVTVDVSTVGAIVETTIVSGKKLTLTASSPTTLTLNSSATSIFHVNGGTLIIGENVILSPGNGRASAWPILVEGGGTVELNGGKISGFSGMASSMLNVGVQVRDGSVFKMTSGTIEGCGDSGGVGILDGGKFIMTGGTIKNNSNSRASCAGGVSILSGGIFIKNGGTVGTNSNSNSSGATEMFIRAGGKYGSSESSLTTYSSDTKFNSPF